MFIYIHICTWHIACVDMGYLAPSVFLFNASWQRSWSTFESGHHQVGTSTTAIGPWVWLPSWFIQILSTYDVYATRCWWNMRHVHPVFPNVTYISWWPILTRVESKERWRPPGLGRISSVWSSWCSAASAGWCHSSPSPGKRCWIRGRDCGWDGSGEGG